MPVWCPARVVEKKIWTEGLFTLRIATQEVHPFEPGQFLHLAVSEGDKIINRPYSVASPHGPELEFFIVLVPEGELTPRLWSLGAGDEIQVSQKAVGSFTLTKAPQAKILWLISTGTGLAPYLAMLATNAIWERYEKVVVVHGVRHAADLAYSDNLRKLSQDKPNRFAYVQATTREQMPGALFGRLTTCLENGSLEQAAGSNISADTSAVMLCGNPDMLNQVEEILFARKLTLHRHKVPGNIVAERYW